MADRSVGEQAEIGPEQYVIAYVKSVLQMELSEAKVVVGKVWVPSYKA